MVIVIIGVLVGLLVPAIAGAMRAANNAAVQSELNALASALTAFRSQFGDYPPSRILLCEDGNYAPFFTSGTYTLGQTASPSAIDQSDGALAARSISALRKMFPRCAQSAAGPLYNLASGWPDYNGNGQIDPPRLISGDECLVFFLGGQPTKLAGPPGSSTPAWATTGWGADPRAPFLVAAKNRIQPLYDFAANRLVDADGDGYPSYVDSLGTSRPIVYFSGYSGAGYDPNDVNFDVGSTYVETDENGTTSPIALRFTVAFPVLGGAPAAISPAPNPYTYSTSVASPANWIKPQSFQVFSAGGDGQYGVGGLYSDSADEPLPVDTANTTPSSDAGIRIRERDNLTNFRNGRLD
jgi:general secretion pathway protein G